MDPSDNLPGCAEATEVTVEDDGEEDDSVDEGGDTDTADECCTDSTAECQACAQDITEEEFCENYEEDTGFAYEGCPEEDIIDVVVEIDGVGEVSAVFIVIGGLVGLIVLILLIV